MRLGCPSQTPTFQSLPVPSRWPRRLEKPPWNWICSWETRMRWGNSSITHWERPWKQENRGSQSLAQSPAMPVSFTVDGGGGGRRWPTYVPSVVNSTVQLECSLVLKAPRTPASDSQEGWRGQEKVPHLV